MTTGNVIVRHPIDIQPITDVCGEIRALSSDEDFKKASLALSTMRAPAIPHYHEVATEFYFVIEGSGKIIVDKKSYEMKSRMLIIIPPDNAHYTIPRKVSRVLAFSVPAWSEEDQIILQEGDTAAGHSGSRERFELIDELHIRKGLGFEARMSQEEREVREAERMDIISRAGWDKLSILELREKLRIS